MKANVAEKNTAEPERALLANRAFFDAVAGGYDYGRAAYFYHDLKRVRHEFDGYIAPHLPVNPLVLDLGCGTGFYSSVLADLGCRRFSCVDLNDAFLKQTEAKLKRFKADIDIQLMQSDLAQFIGRAEALPAFDLIVIGSVLQYINNHTDLLTDLVQAQPQATYYITSHQLGPHRQWAILEEGLARLDYFYHRLKTRQFRVAHKTPAGAPILTPVDAPALERVFASQGFTFQRAVYTTYHTDLFNAWFRCYKPIKPRAGSYFSLIATRSNESN